MSEQLDAIAVFITAPNRDEAAQLAEALVNDKLAACVQILPEMTSVYRWQGKIERQPECLIIAKTTNARFVELETRVRTLHSYEVPEIVAVPIVTGSKPYLEWLASSVAGDVESD